MADIVDLDTYRIKKDPTLSLRAIEIARFMARRRGDPAADQASREAFKRAARAYHRQQREDNSDDLERGEPNSHRTGRSRDFTP